MTPKAGTGRVSRARRSEQLLNLALELIVAEGFEALTMARLAREAGVTKPIVYRIYPNRAALIAALLRREQKRAERVLDAAVPTDPGGAHPREVLSGAIEGILVGVERDPLTWQLALIPPEGTPRVIRELIERRRRAFIRRASRLVRWGVAWLPGGAALDLEVLSRVLVAIVEQQARMLLRRPGVERAELAATARAVIAAIDWLDEPARPARSG